MKNALRAITLTAIGSVISFTASASITAVPSDKTIHRINATTAPVPADPNLDPYESFNRKVFAFNKVADGLLLKPWAYLYTNGIWSPAQHSIHNAFNNIAMITTIPNDLLQGNGKFFLNDICRFVINSTAGIAGLFDVARHVGLPPHQNDFGSTLAKWGAKKSAFVDIPLLGALTLRDTFAWPIDTGMSIWPYLYPEKKRYALYAASLVDARAQLLPADKLMNKAFDPYVFYRNAYLQNRAAEIAENIGDAGPADSDIIDGNGGSDIISMEPVGKNVEHHKNGKRASHEKV